MIHLKLIVDAVEFNQKSLLWILACQFVSLNGLNENMSILYNYHHMSHNVYFQGCILMFTNLLAHNWMFSIGMFIVAF